MNDDDQIDRELREEGQRWRATRQSELTRVDPALFVAQPRASASGWARGHIGTVAAFCVGVALVAVLFAAVAVSIPGGLLGFGASEPAIDVSITPVSRSNPSEDAKRALDACGITSYNPGDVGGGLVDPDDRGIGVVAGMGLVPHARDAGEYAALGVPPNIDPHLNTDQPAWVITTSGWFTDPWIAGILIKDPTCAVVEGDWTHHLWIETGGGRDADGVLRTSNPEYAPIKRLPPLAP